MKNIPPLITTELKAQSIPTLVREYGSSSSICCLAHDYLFYSTEGIDGAIGFKMAAGCAVVMGEPLCKEEDKIPLALAFKETMSKQKTPILYVTVSETFSKKAYGSICYSLIEVVDELICNPQQDPKIGSKGRLLRSKVKQARRYGITTYEYTGNDPSLERSLQKIALDWLSERRGPQIFLSSVDLFAVTEGRRWVYAVHQNEIIAVALLQQMSACNGWLMQLLLTLKKAPNGTSELLVDSCIDILRKEGCSHLSFGSTQKQNLGTVQGLSKASTALARIIYRAAQKLFPLQKRKKFWMKFSPLSVKAFLLFEKKRISIKEIRALLKALNAKV